MRYEKAIIYILQILNSFATRVAQLGFGKIPEVSGQIIEVMIELRDNYGINL